LCFTTFDNILKTVDFLYNELNVTNYKLLPYNLQLIFITDFFKNNKSPNIDQKSALKKWFWQTSYSNYFSIYSLSKQRKAFFKFQEFSKGKTSNPLYKASNENFSVSEFPKTIYYGSVRSKTLALFMIKNLVDRNIVMAENNDIEDFYSLMPPYKDAEYMFPKFKGLEYLPPFDSLKIYSKRNKDYSFILDKTAENFDYIGNFIPTDIDNVSIFGALRYNLIKEKEKEFVDSLGGLDYETFFDMGKYSIF